MSKNLKKYLHEEMDKSAGIAHSLKKTKIVATVGPACSGYDALLELVKAGVNVFRLNFSHGTHEDKIEVIKHIRAIIKNEPFNIAILADLQGPKLRVGDLEDGKILLEPGNFITLTCNKMVGNSKKIYVRFL